MSSLNVDSGQGAGAESSPNSQVSTPNQPSIEGSVASLITSLESKFTDQIGNLSKELRGLQSRQDKSDNNFQQQLARFNQIKNQNNFTDEQAMDAMNRADSEAQRWASLEKRLENLTSLVTSGGSQVTTQQKAADTFAKLGLDTQDPRVAPFLAKQYENADAMELAAYRLKNELLNSPNPTPAQSASLQGSSNDTGQESLRAEYTQKLAPLRGNVLAISQLQAEYRKKGLLI